MTKEKFFHLTGLQWTVLLGIGGIAVAILAWLWPINQSYKEVSTPPPNTHAELRTNPPEKKKVTASSPSKKALAVLSNRSTSQPNTPNPSVINASNSNVVVGPVHAPVTQTINNNLKLKDPKFQFRWNVENKPSGSIFISTGVFTVDVDAPLNVRLMVSAPSIEEFALLPVGMQTSIVMGGYENGFHYYDLPSAKGDYSVTVRTKNPEKIKVGYTYAK